MEYFDYNSNPDFDRLGPAQDFDVEEFLERSRVQERQRLEDELDRIEQQLEQREKIHSEVIEELESKLEWYLDRLDTLYTQHRGKTGRRDEIKTRIKEFYRELREEKQSKWRDRQELEGERRELMRLLEEVEDDGITEFL